MPRVCTHISHKPHPPGLLSPAGPSSAVNLRYKPDVAAPKSILKRNGSEPSSSSAPSAAAPAPAPAHPVHLNAAPAPPAATPASAPAHPVHLRAAAIPDQRPSRGDGGGTGRERDGRAADKRDGRADVGESVAAQDKLASILSFLDDVEQEVGVEGVWMKSKLPGCRATAGTCLFSTLSPHPIDAIYVCLSRLKARARRPRRSLRSGAPRTRSTQPP